MLNELPVPSPVGTLSKGHTADRVSRLHSTFDLWEVVLSLYWIFS